MNDMASLRRRYRSLYFDLIDNWWVWFVVGVHDLLRRCAFCSVDAVAWLMLRIESFVRRVDGDGVRFVRSSEAEEIFYV